MPKTVVSNLPLRRPVALLRLLRTRRKDHGFVPRNALSGARFLPPWSFDCLVHLGQRSFRQRLIGDRKDFIMWPLCSANSFLWTLLPLLIGLLTGWWAWARSNRDAGLAYSTPVPAANPIAAARAAAPDTVPVRAPEPTAPVAAFEAPKANTAGIGLAGAGLAGAAALTAIGIPAAVGKADDLLIIKGIGPKLNGVLNGLGITRFDQIANWSAGDVDKVDDHLGEFKDRIGREEWIPQAKLLAAGNHSEWERIYGTVKKVAAVGAGAVALTAIGIPAAVGKADDLLQIKGIGPKLNTLLISLGVTRFDQIAAWGAAEIDKVDDHLGNFKNRITRDSWVEQAGLLAKGMIAEFEAKFGKLDSENK
jgi:predicted flap endonuclease-1-like 5' DNA nuclease